MVFPQASKISYKERNWLEEYLLLFANNVTQFINYFLTPIAIPRIITIAADPLPENVLGSLPTVRVRLGSHLLDEGQQCRICLQNFTLGQRVRTLPCLQQGKTGDYTYITI